MKPVAHVYQDLEALSRAVARELEGVARMAIDAQGRFSLVLSGGSTPRLLYRLLAGEFGDRIRWQNVHLFWGDERYVPPDDPHSNYRMVKETFLEQLPLLPHNVHPMPTTHANPDDAARAYESVLDQYFPGSWPHFDLMLLGLAADGHIASLFPGSAALDERSRRVVAVRAPVDPPQRLTLTLPVFNHAARIYFLVAGKMKAGALHRVLVGPCDPRTCPALGVRPEAGTVTWWVDEAAATFIPAIRRA